MPQTHARIVTSDATPCDSSAEASAKAEGWVDLRALFPELWARRAPGGALLDRSLRPMPPAEAGVFLASQLELWRAHRRLCLDRLKSQRRLHIDDVNRLRGQARIYRDFIDRAERVLAEWGLA